MNFQEIGQWAVSAPIIATVVAAYHKVIVLPHRNRIEKLEEICDNQNKTLARLDERTLNMWKLLDKQFNGKK